MKTDDVLDMIDHAVEDWEVSHDAMRWTPEPVQATKGRRYLFEAAGARIEELMSIATIFNVPPELIEPARPRPMSIGFTPASNPALMAAYRNIGEQIYEAATREGQSRGFNADRAFLDEINPSAWLRYRYLNPVISEAPERWTFNAD